jgi:hypothetical protein
MLVQVEPLGECGERLLCRTGIGTRKHRGMAGLVRGIQRLRDTSHLAFSFLRYCGLSLW